jgi:hypothetical protein
MKRTIVCLAGVSACIALVVAGVLGVAQKRNRSDLIERLERSRGLNRMGTTSVATSSYTQRVRARLCEALAAATPESLQVPLLAVWSRLRCALANSS